MVEEEVLQRVIFEGGGVRREPSTTISTAPPPSILQSLPLHVSFDHGYYLLVKAIQELRDRRKGLPVSVGIGGPSGSGKTSLAEKVASVLGCVVVSMENYRVSVDDGSDLESIDFDTLVQNLKELMNGDGTSVPVFDFQDKRRIGSKSLKVLPSGVVIVEGTYALHSVLRSLLDIRVAVVGGVHFSLLSKVRHDIGDSCSLDYLIDSIFPLFRKHIEPDLHHAQIRINNSFVSSFREPYYKLKCRNELKIRNDFDPVLSPESSLFVLKSNKQVTYQDINKVLDHGKVCSSIQNFTDIYLKLPGTPSNGNLEENECIRVRICEGRFALLIREPLREGNFIIQPKVDFDISVSTVAGLLHLGYQAVACVEASALIYQDGKILVEVDHLQAVEGPYLQIKGVNKEIVAATASSLNLEGSYTTKSYLQIILERLPAYERNYAGIHSQQSAKLREVVAFIQSQSPDVESLPAWGSLTPNDIKVIEDMQLRIKRLEKWHKVNMVLWTFLMSGIIGYTLYQRKQH